MFPAARSVDAAIAQATGCSVSHLCAAAYLPLPDAPARHFFLRGSPGGASGPSMGVTCPAPPTRFIEEVYAQIFIDLNLLL